MKEQVNIDQLFQKAKTQPVAVSFEKTKNEFLKSLSAEGKTPPTDGKGSFFTLKNVIIMISSISAISSIRPRETTIQGTDFGRWRAKTGRKKYIGPYQTSCLRNPPTPQSGRACEIRCKLKP